MAQIAPSRAAAIGVLLAWASAASARELRRAGGAWALVWSDEFDGPEVNTTNWNIYSNISECGMPGCTGNQIELYTANNVFIDAADGTSALVLRTQQQDVPWPGFRFNVTSGRVDSQYKVNVTYGRVEISAKLQNDVAALGIHTAHWMVGYACWPVGAEIDIMEMQSPGNVYLGDGSCDQPGWAKATSNYHYNTPGAGHCGQQIAHSSGKGSWPGAPDPAVNFTSHYTTFGVEWNATDLVYFIVYNGTERMVNHVFNGMPGWTNGTALVPQWPMYIILSQAYMRDRPCGNPPDWAWPITQRIDFVRVYEWVPSREERRG